MRPHQWANEPIAYMKSLLPINTVPFQRQALTQIPVCCPVASKYIAGPNLYTQHNGVRIVAIDKPACFECVQSCMEQ